jgi:3-isopropylmalate/(R)-2-methylmalate dehydratase small subunit
MIVQPFETIDSTFVCLPVDDVDTDQIVPARFLKGTARDGLENALFADWRARAHAAGRTFPLDAHGSHNATVLVAGRNFGCGSSREHAVWALQTRFRAILAPSFADIFRTNALENGLLPVVVEEAVHGGLITAQADARVIVNLGACTLRLPDGRTVEFEVDPFARRCMLDGTDRLGALLRRWNAYDAWLAGRGEFVATTQVKGGARCAH